MLKLNLHSNQKERVILVWQFKNGAQAHDILELKPGLNELDLGYHPQWKGNIEILATDNPRVKASLVRMNSMDKINRFLRPHLFTPRSINFSEPLPFFGYEFRNILYVFILIIALILILFKIPWRKSIFIALIAATILISIRNTINEVATIAAYDANQEQLDPFIEMKAFIKQIKPMIEGKIWSKEKLGGVYDSYALYALAEYKYMPAKEVPQGAFILTRDPKNRPVLHQYKSFYLIQK